MKATKIVVVGGGLAGLMSTVKAIDAGATVDLFSVVPVRRSHSVCAQGGINAAIDTKGEGDSPAEHFYDTVYGGDFLAHQAPVQKMCETAPQIVHLFDRMGVQFNRTPEGHLDLRSFGGAKKRRTAFAGGTTGQQLMYSLDEQVRRFEAEGKVRKFELWDFMSIIKDGSGRCRGITALNMNTMESQAFPADAVIMCTGGYSYLYGKCTGSTHCNGAATTQVYKQGATFANPEFVQIHPTAIPGQDKMRLISEGVRGDGGRVWVVKNGQPWYFLEEMYPAYGNTVPRDIASRAIWNVVKDMGLGIDGEDCVYLDVTHIPAEVLDQRLKGILEIYEKFKGIDPRYAPMKVFPGVHYTMGGLWVDDNHMTNVEGLFAAGESDYQYHGANRLGANSLLSVIYSGTVAGPAAVEFAKDQTSGAADLSADVMNQEKETQDAWNNKLYNMNGYENPHKIKQELADIMSNDVYVVRENKVLEKTDERILELRERFLHCGLPDKTKWANDQLLFMRQLQHQFDLASMVAGAALNRNESRGAHYKPEFAKRNDKEWLCVTKANYTEQGPSYDYSEKVNTDTIAPVERRYDVTRS